ncbi:ABC transporter ATP-binding protein [Streptomyces pinistramenti]|uniref:ABC transporter ATP-binding protein n=1 Tax=Streptomyces pinistramenti TaxID=2884812 RepID=UPI001D06E1CD|nr:ABC transporter ATP-binding protein [Streptomyces pinistramenti]MCB5908451.1 ABC transporter ATP-binding protein/permease [Streptomyces pinistramenti]
MNPVDPADAGVSARLRTVLPFAIRLAWHADRTRLLLVVGLQLASAIGLGAAVLALRGTLTRTVSLDNAGDDASLTALIAHAAVLVVLATLGGVVTDVVDSQELVLSAKLEREAVGRVLDVSAHAEPYQFEDPEFHNRVERAITASQHQPTILLFTALSMIQSALSVVIVAVTFATMVWWLVPLLVIAAIPTLRTLHRMRLAYYGVHRDLAENRRRREYLQQTLTGRREAAEVHALRLGPLLLNRWQADFADEVDRRSVLAQSFLWRQLGARALGDFVLLATLTTLALATYAHWIELSTTLTAVGGLWLLSTQMRNTSSVLASTGETTLYINDLRLLTTNTRPPALPERQLPHHCEITATGIGFTYPGSLAPVLHDVSLSLPAGQVVALVGTNGSGKTTLAKILAGIYPPDHGEILLNGQHLTDTRTLRSLSTVVFQDFLRYRMSVTDNIAFGRPGVPIDAAAVTRAARLAGIHTAIDALAAGYDTILGKEFNEGADLSLGQWQRLAIARAFYRSTPLVILDEPSASLDPQAEAELFAHIRRLFAGRTVLLISHRLYGVCDADRIYVLDKGALVEQGTHDQLLADDGHYAGLFQAQASAYVSQTPTMN